MANIKPSIRYIAMPILLLAFIFANASAQERFDKLMPGYKTQNVIELPDQYVSFGLEGTVNSGILTDHSIVAHTFSKTGTPLDTIFYTIEDLVKLGLDSTRLDSSTSFTDAKATYYQEEKEQFLISTTVIQDGIWPYNHILMLNQDLSMKAIYNVNFDTFKTEIRQIYPIEQGSNYLLAGCYRHENSNFQAFIARYDSNFNELWKQTLQCQYHGTGPCNFIPTALTYDSTGDNALMTVKKGFDYRGSPESYTSSIFSIDSNGVNWRMSPVDRDSLSTRTMELLPSPHNDHYYAFWDYSHYRYNHNPKFGFDNSIRNYHNNIWMARFNRNGEVLDKKKVITPGMGLSLRKDTLSGYLIDVKLGDQGNFYIAGDGTYSKPPFAAKLDTQGQILWKNLFHKEFGENLDPSTGYYLDNTEMTVTSDGGCILNGRYLEAITNQGLTKQTGFVLKTDENGCLWDENCHKTGIEENQQNDSLKVYPNPAQSQITIETAPQQEKLFFELVSQQGKSVRSGYLNQGNHVVDVNQLTKGIYLLKVQNPGENSPYVEKVVVH